MKVGGGQVWYNEFLDRIVVTVHSGIFGNLIYLSGEDVYVTNLSKEQLKEFFIYLGEL